jgi:PHP family Zn ribbon phosphoesterase
MTPGNIVGLAKLAGLNILALTDHQSCGNCAAAMAIAEAFAGPVVIPGMEIESSEEIHLLCLFPDLAAARAMEATIRQSLLPLQNRPDIFGEQLLFNEDDECCGKEDLLLLQASQLSCDIIARDVLAQGGVCIPAHLDRPANSMLVTLGAVPDDFPTACIELSRQADRQQFFAKHPELLSYQLLVDSDAHHLAGLLETGWPIEVAPFTTAEEGRRSLIAALRPRNR